MMRLIRNKFIIYLFGTTKVAISTGSNYGPNEIHATSPKLRVKLVILRNIDGQASGMKQTCVVHMLTVCTAQNVPSIIN